MKTYLRDLITASSMALALGFWAAAAQAQGIIPTPSVPTAIQAPDGNVPFFMAHATGTQNYTCVPSAGVYGWKVAPQATLSVELRWFGRTIGQQVATHFLSPAPDNTDLGRPTWQNSGDTSAVWGAAIANSSDPAFVVEGAIPWVLLKAVATKPGPAGGGALVPTTYIQRINTSGGATPTENCSATEGLGVTKFVPYFADYVFYKTAPVI